MKRYSEGMYGMVADPTGEYYSRADLIAAGVLVPVPDGEVMLDSIEEECIFIDRDGDFGFASGGECWLRPNEVVTKIRLVKLEDVG
jgi:hypothetical protein